MSENNNINTVVMIWIYDEYSNIPLLFTVKPPVPAVAKAILSASNTETPPHKIKMNCAKVIVK